MIVWKDVLDHDIKEVNYIVYPEASAYSTAEIGKVIKLGSTKSRFWIKDANSDRELTILVRSVTACRWNDSLDPHKKLVTVSRLDRVTVVPDDRVPDRFKEAIAKAGIKR